jgi:hypothetical protein
MALCKSLLDQTIFSLDVAQFSEATPENIKIGTLGLTTNFQPANTRYPASPLRLRGRYREQAYPESKNHHTVPHSRPIHAHCTASGLDLHTLSLPWGSRYVLAPDLNCSE